MLICRIFFYRHQTAIKFELPRQIAKVITYLQDNIGWNQHFWRKKNSLQSAKCQNCWFQCLSHICPLPVAIPPVYILQKWLYMFMSPRQEMISNRWQNSLTTFYRIVILHSEWYRNWKRRLQVKNFDIGPMYFNSFFF